MVHALTAAAQSLPPPDIKPARHFEFLPPTGTAWYLDGSADGVKWSAEAGPFFATGKSVHHLQPAGATTRFRLRYVNPAAVGSAPVDLTGTSLVMEKSGHPIEVVFMNAVRGILRLDDSHARSFTYAWTKTSPDGGEAILSGLDGTTTLLRLDFRDASLGRWGMEDIPGPASASLIKQTIDAGVFSFREGRFRRGRETAQLPGDLTGKSLVLNEAGQLTHIRFTGLETAVLKTAGGTLLDAGYSYDPESAAAGKLRFDIPGADPLRLKLDLENSGVGRFENIPSAAGLPTERTGTFSLPDEHEPPLNPNCPPPSVAGRSLLIRDSAPCTITFLADGSGRITKIVDGAVQMTPFFYSYSCTGGRSAKVSLTFPGGAGDAIDEFEMTWNDDCTGEFKRSSFANGTAAGQGAGTFGPGEPAGWPAGVAPGLGM
jgi:hypothetical protein